MPVNNRKKDKNPMKLQPTKEFVVIGGNDAELWGDIYSPADKAWQDRVWQQMLDKKNSRDNSE